MGVLSEKEAMEIWESVQKKVSELQAEQGMSGDLPPLPSLDEMGDIIEEYDPAPIASEGSDKKNINADSDSLEENNYPAMEEETLGMTEETPGKEEELDANNYPDMQDAPDMDGNTPGMEETKLEENNYPKWEEGLQKKGHDYNMVKKAFSLVTEGNPDLEGMNLEGFIKESRRDPKYMGGKMSERGMDLIGKFNPVFNHDEFAAMDPETKTAFQSINKDILDNASKSGKLGDGGKEYYNTYDNLFKKTNKVVADSMLKYGAGGKKLMKEIMAKSTYSVDENFFDVDGKEPYVYNAFNEDIIDSYLDNMAAFGKDGSIEKAVKAVKKPSKEAEAVLKSLNTMKENFLNRGPEKAGSEPKSSVLESFNKEDLADLRKQCDAYMKKHGYEDNKENKMIREISLQADRAAMADKSRNHALKYENISVDDVFTDKIKNLQEKLQSLSGSLTGNSKEFEAMKNALNNVAEGHVLNNHLEDLFEAANEYMEAKGSSKRATSKGQLRYDIAKEIAQLAKDANPEVKEKEVQQPKEMEAEKETRKKTNLSGLMGAEKGSNLGLSGNDYKEYVKEYVKIMNKTTEKKAMEQKGKF